MFNSLLAVIAFVSTTSFPIELIHISFIDSKQWHISSMNSIQEGGIVINYINYHYENDLIHEFFITFLILTKQDWMNSENTL